MLTSVSPLSTEHRMSTQGIIYSQSFKVWIFTIKLNLDTQNRLHEMMTDEQYTTPPSFVHNYEIILKKKKTDEKESQ